MIAALGPAREAAQVVGPAFAVGVGHGAGQTPVDGSGSEVRGDAGRPDSVGEHAELVSLGVRHQGPADAAVALGS
jgi:hypothetical protein